MPRRKRGQLIDAMDARIISQLAQDGRLPNVAIAKAVGLSETAVRRRVERLLNNNVVQVACQTNSEALGYKVNIIFNLLVDSSQAEEIGRRLALERNVQYVAVSLGKYDLILWASFKSHEEMLDFIANRLRTIPGVHRCQAYPVFQVLKQTTEWNPLAREQPASTVRSRRHRAPARKPQAAAAPKSAAPAQPEATARRQRKALTPTSRKPTSQLRAPTPRRQRRASRAP